jgi:hypothetical protein
LHAILIHQFVIAHFAQKLVSKDSSMHPSFINSAGDFSKSSLPRLTHHEGYRKVDGETLAALQQAHIQDNWPMKIPVVASALEYLLRELNGETRRTLEKPTHLEHYTLANQQGSLVRAHWSAYTTKHAYANALFQWFEAHHKTCPDYATALSTDNLEFGRMIGIEPQDWPLLTPKKLQECLDAYLCEGRHRWIADAIWLLWLETLPWSKLDSLGLDQGVSMTANPKEE